MRKILTILFCLFLFLQQRSFAQENQFVFSHLKEKDGLSDNIVNCFLKDSRGILWIGTYNGFNRFDGANFLVYKKRKGTNSMVNEVVHSLCEDKEGNIWGATDNGVFCYQPAEDKYINYTIKSHGTGLIFYNILCDKQGVVWAAGDWSVFKFNATKNNFDETIKMTDSRDSLRFYKIRKNGFLADPSGKGLWLATQSGMMYYDVEKNSMLNFSNQPGDSLFVRRSVSALSLSSSGKMWFFNNKEKELISFDPANKKILQRLAFAETIPAADGASTFEDKNHRVWFSSWTYQVTVTDLKNGNKTYPVINRAEDNRTIASTFFWAALQDDDGTIWLGTVAGISRCNPEVLIYKEHHLPESIPELKDAPLHLAEEDPTDKSIWLMTRSFAIFHYYPQQGKYEKFDLKNAELRADGIQPGTVNMIRFVKDRAVISTNTGSWQIKKGSTRITPYDYLPAGYEDFRCYEILPDADSVIYFNNSKEVLHWNHLTGRTVLIRYSPGTPLPENGTIVSNLFLSPARKLWMISANTHISYRSSENQLTRIKLVNEEANASGVLLSIDADKNENIWVLNKGVGLYCYNPVTKAIQFWDETDGLPGSRMHKMKTDHAGRIWSMMYTKASVFIPGSDRFYNFKLPFSESKLNYYNHISTLSNGNIFGTVFNDIVEFFPDRVTAVPGKINPRISQLSVNEKKFALLGNDKIILAPSQNTIRLRFGVLTDREIFPYDIEYILDGAENRWTTSSGNNEALYNNLSPGNYKFRVRVKGKNNAWQTGETSLDFSVKAPFYKTIWFLVLLGLLIIGVIIFVYRYRLTQKEKLLLLESKAQLLEKEKVMVMYDSLKQQLNPHFLFNSLTSLSGLIETDQQIAGDFLEQMSGIYRYILKNGDTETVFLKDEIEFVQLYINLQQTRFKKGLQVNIDVPEEYRHYKIAPVTLQNLIENAIKHNIIDTASPLVIDIFIDGVYLVVKNNLQKKNVVETSNKKGLAQFTSLYRYLSELPVAIEETKETFKIKIPLI